MHSDRVHCRHVTPRKHIWHRICNIDLFNRANVNKHELVTEISKRNVDKRTAPSMSAQPRWATQGDIPTLAGLAIVVSEIEINPRGIYQKRRFDIIGARRAP
jgi:hypothetical protein